MNFVVKPSQKDDGSTDLSKWDIKAPAKETSIWYLALMSGTRPLTRTTRSGRPFSSSAPSLASPSSTRMFTSAAGFARR